MSDAIIQVEGLGKKYRIRHQGERQRYVALRDVIAEKAKSLFRRPGARSMEQEATPGSSLPAPSSPLQARATREDFWALRDVSFEVKRGEVVGIIGRNGAGKSTLLKILSRITEPTAGSVKLRGRVASLLEVGTGFHPELTGRENIFLNGAILGMSRVEIKRKFDEIVAFAEVEKFLDTPVKRYSSGMYVRLAFAVAAHLEPEILIVDEVLAVGDAEFQKKCLGKMKDVSSHGRTVLFVSHNMQAVQQLCSKLVWLQSGTVINIGNTADLIREYLNGRQTTNAVWSRPSTNCGQSDVEILHASIVDSSFKTTDKVCANEGFGIKISIRCKKDFKNMQVAIRFTNQDGIPSLSTCNTDNSRAFVPINTGLHHFAVVIPASLLAPGIYTLIIAAHLPKIGLLDVVEDQLKISINEIGSLGAVFGDGRLGVVQPVLNWQHYIASSQI